MMRFLPCLAGAAILYGLALSSATARQDVDPIYNEKKASAWMDSLVNDASARKRALAIEALAKLWTDKQYKGSLPNIGRALRLDSSVAVRTQAAIALGTLKEEHVKFVEKELIDSLGAEKESRVRKEIAVAIARSPAVAKLAVAQLTEALKDPDPATRAAVAEALAQTGSEGKSSAAGLAPLLQDPDLVVRRSATIALGRIAPEGSPAIAETMAKMLATEKETNMKRELATSLGLLAEKSPVVVLALAGLLTDPDEDLRRKAARILRAFGTAAEPAANALLTAAKMDKAKDVRLDAIRTFGSALGMKLKERMGDLLALLKDPEFEIRLTAVEEIGSLGYELKDDAKTLAELRKRQSDPHPKVREAIAAAIRKIETKPMPKKEPLPKKEP